MDSDFWNLCHRLGDSLSLFILILCLNVLRTLSLSLVLRGPIRIFRVTPQQGRLVRVVVVVVVIGDGHKGPLIPGKNPFFAK
jgi:hypothetical protein